MINAKVRARIAALEADQVAWDSKVNLANGSAHYWIFEKPMSYNELQVLKLRVFDGKA